MSVENRNFRPRSIILNVAIERGHRGMTPARVIYDDWTDAAAATDGDDVVKVL